MPPAPAALHVGIASIARHQCRLEREVRHPRTGRDDGHAPFVDRRRRDALLFGCGNVREKRHRASGHGREGLAVQLDLGEGRPIPQERLTNGMRAWLDPPVREAATVFVNDQRAGSLWAPPYTLTVTHLLRPGANAFRIEVANVAINHMAGRALPDYRLLNLRYGTRFEPQDMDKVKPVPAGLTGPITLRSY